MKKGRNTFTSKEIEIIKKLVGKKQSASTNEQKTIREQIRNLKFYYSDFSNKKDFSIESIDKLISTGKIVITDNISTFVENTLPEKVENLPQPKNLKPLTSVKDITINGLIASFKGNCFNPLTDKEDKIPQSAGNYLICLKKGKSLPQGLSPEPIYSVFDGLQVLYTGIAGSNLRKRDFKQHFTGNNAGSSTLRKSLGVLFGYKKIPRDKNTNSGKTKFNEQDEQKLTEWMRENLVMYYYTSLKYEQVEKILIKHFNPPLNISGNKNEENKAFRIMLKKLRSNK